MTYINESGYYSLILVSKFESAKRTKLWVTLDVFPTILKHGAFVANNNLEYTEKRMR